MTQSTLRLTETNSADDSKGRTWGLEGNLFWYVTGGAFASVLTLLFLFGMVRASFGASLMAAAIPLSLTFIYVFVFRHGKPSGYDKDCLDYWINGPAFGPNSLPQRGHPLKGEHV